MESRKSSYSAGESLNWCSHAGDQHGDFWQKTKNRLSYDHTLSLGGRNHEAKQHTQTNVHYRTASESQDMETLISQKMNGKMWYTYTKQTYSEIKMKKRMSFVATCQDTAEITLREGTQTQRMWKPMWCSRWGTVRKGNPLGLWNDPRLKPYSQQPRPGSNHSIHPQRVDKENLACV